MILLGTTINALSVAVGALIGVLLSNLLSKNARLVDLPQVALKAISLCVISAITKKTDADHRYRADHPNGRR